MSNIFDTVAFKNRVYRNMYKSVSYEKILDCDWGNLIPTMARFAVPGDIWRIGQGAFFRTVPMFTPEFTGIKVKFRSFFTPLRILDENAEEIISGYDKDDNETSKSFGSVTITPQAYGFYDYMGISLNKIHDTSDVGSMANYWERAYRMIWNEWYRDPQLQQEIDITTQADSLLKVNYRRDYFTSALLNRQLGVASSLPLTGSIPASIPLVADFGKAHIEGINITNEDFDFATGHNKMPLYLFENHTGANGAAGGSFTFITNGTKPFGANGFTDYLNGNNELIAYKSGAPVTVDGTTRSTVNSQSGIGNAQDTHLTGNFEANGPYYIQGRVPLLSSGTVDLALAGGQFDISTLREAFARQSILERANRAGSRFNEFLRANFGIAPRDETLQRPVYLGGSSCYISVNEVIQQSATTADSPLGDMAGKGIGLTNKVLSPYLVKEPGLIMTLMSITPDTLYCSQGINRQYTYKSRWDFFNPELQNLSEQAVYNSELYIDGTADDHKIFGYQPPYQELRTSQSEICGSFRNTLESWHLARKFSSRPNLNSNFITVDSTRDNLNRNFVQTQNAKPFYCHIYNSLSVMRPLVKFPIPATL